MDGPKLLKRMKMKKENKSREDVLSFIENLPENRKIYYRFGNLMVEITKEEALRLLESDRKDIGGAE